MKSKILYGLVCLVLTVQACLPIPSPPPSPTNTATPIDLPTTETSTPSLTVTSTETSTETPTETATETATNTATHTATASATITATETSTITPTATSTALNLPSLDDWDAGVLAFSHGAEGEWDYILWGGKANSLIKKDGTYYLYYQGSQYYDTQCESVAYRAVGVATSTDGIEWTKFADNPILTWSRQGSVEEGVTSSAAWLGPDGRIYLYYGANTGTGCHVNTSARLAVSEDGLHFQDMGEVLSGSDPDIWGSGDEIFPVGVFVHENRWTLYYTPNGVPLSRKLGVALGGAPNLFDQTTGVNEGTIQVWGPVSVVPASGRSALFVNPSDDQQGALDLYWFDAADPSRVELHDSYSLPNCNQSSVLYEEDTNRWLMSCRDQTRENYYIRTAIVP